VYSLLVLSWQDFLLSAGNRWCAASTGVTPTAAGGEYKGLSGERRSNLARGPLC
jgi:hypothetical protein